MTQIIFYTLIAVGLTVILVRPHWGIILLFVSVALTETLPEFPFLNSVFPVWGVATILGFIIRNIQYRLDYVVNFELLYAFTLVFVLWMFVSNPDAATGGGTRNWIFTFVQLFILASLTGILMNDEKKFLSLMFWFSVALAGSAIYGITHSSIEATRMGSDIEAGLLGGKNAAARYYIVASLFTYYLQRITTNSIRKLFLRGVLAILIIGVLFTLSRAGLGLLIFATFMVVIIELKYSIRQFIPLITFAVIMMIVLPDTLYDTYLSVITGQEFETGGRGAEYSSVENNIRYTLWYSGVEMWKTSPFTGVGIGQFSFNVASYLPFSLAYLNLGAHNMFIQLLAETGIIGLLFFISILVMTYINFKGQLDGKNNLNRIWMIAFFVMVIGGLMKHDHYDKLLWLLIGSSVAFKNYWSIINPRSETG